MLVGLASQLSRYDGMETVGEGTAAVYVAQKVVKAAEPPIAARRQLLCEQSGAITLGVAVVATLELVDVELFDVELFDVEVVVGN